MSQTKVEKNKELKRNRKKIVKRQKFMTRIYILIAAAATCALAVWIGFTARHYYNNWREKNPVTTKVDLSELTKFSQSLSDSTN